MRRLLIGVTGVLLMVTAAYAADPAQGTDEVAGSPVSQQQESKGLSAGMQGVTQDQPEMKGYPMDTLENTDEYDSSTDKQDTYNSNQDVKNIFGDLTKHQLDTASGYSDTKSDYPDLNKSTTEDVPGANQSSDLSI